MKKLLLALALFLAPTVAFAQCNGSFSANKVCGTSNTGGLPGQQSATVTVNGVSCTLGGSCTVSTSAASITVGTTTIASGTPNGLLYDNAGVLGNLSTANNGVLVTSNSGVASISTTLPSGLAAINMSLVTPTLGVATATSLNGLTITTSTGTLTIVNGKVLTIDNSLELAGTDLTKMTFPSTSDTVVGLAATQSLTNKTITSSTNTLGGVTMGLGSDAGGDTLYNSGGLLARLAIGVSGALYQSNGSAPTWTVTPAITSGTLSAGANALSVSATQPASPVAQQNAVSIAVTGAGSASQINTAFDVAYSAGYTGSSSSIAAIATNANVSTGNTLIPTGGNNLAVGNIGLYGIAGASAALDIGVVGQGNSVSASGTSIGVLGIAQNTSGTHQVGVAGTALSFDFGIGGWFTLNGTLPNLSAALVADSGTNGNAIAYFLAGGATLVTVQTSGGLSLNTATDPGAGGLQATLVNTQTLAASLTNTAISSTINQVSATATLTPASSSNQTFNSLTGSLTLAGSQNITAVQRGLLATVNNSGTGTISTIRGNATNLQNTSTGVITSGFIYSATLSNGGGGTITTGASYNVAQPQGPTTGVTSTWTNIYGVEINDQNPSSSGGGANTLTNAPVALHIESQTASGAFAIQQVGSGLNSFAGTVTLNGCTIGSNQFCVTGTSLHNGHILATGSAPSISSCGTGSPSVSGGDNFGTVIAGGGVLSSCVINFGATWGTAPRCVASSGTAIASLTVTASTTQLTIGGTSITGDTINWVCGSSAMLNEPVNDNEQSIRRVA
jgi:hypothetical protein